MSGFRYQHGRLLYRRQSTGKVRGREDWALTANRDGSRTLRSLALTDDSEFVRDAIFTLDADHRPVEALIRLQVADRWIGSGYFRALAGRLVTVTDSEEGGHVHQSLDLPERFHLISHAVMHDGWMVWPYDAASGGEQSVTVYNTSTRWNGTDGPLGRLESLRIERLADEEVTVPAGTFAAERYRFASEEIEGPPGEIWVTPEDRILLRYDWSELDLEYVLESLLED